jgi:orotate phosphoribosyltransferase
MKNSHITFDLAQKILISREFYRLCIVEMQYKSRKGQYFEFYLEKFNMFAHPAFMKTLVRYLVSEIKQLEFDTFGVCHGDTYSLAAILAFQLSKPLSIIKTTPVHRPTGPVYCDGEDIKDKKVLLFDLSHGSALLGNAIKKIRDYGGHISHAYTVINLESHTNPTILKKANVTCLSFLTISDLNQIAVTL